MYHNHTRYFFINTPPTTEIYTLSLHDALPIYIAAKQPEVMKTLAAAYNAWWRDVTRDGFDKVPMPVGHAEQNPVRLFAPQARDRKSTRLNSSHVEISYAVFCLKKKNKNQLNYS